jgi:hypothetical protein
MSYVEGMASEEETTPVLAKIRQEREALKVELAGLKSSTLKIIAGCSTKRPTPNRVSSCFAMTRAVSLGA